MKTILQIFLILISSNLFAQKVFKVQYESQADIKVYSVQYESQADLKVFMVKY